LKLHFIHPYNFSPSIIEIGDNLKFSELIEAWEGMSPAFDDHSGVKPLAFKLAAEYQD
jgi:hypothetical protein